MKTALYTADPKKQPDATFIPEIGARDLMERDMDDLVIERPCLEIIQNSEVIDRVQIINGMVPGKHHPGHERRACGHLHLPPVTLAATGGSDWSASIVPQADHPAARNRGDPLNRCCGPRWLMVRSICSLFSLPQCKRMVDE